MGQILPTFHYSWHCRKRWRATSAPTSTSQRRRPPRDSGPTIKESFLGINGLFPGIYGFSREFVATFWESMAFLPGVIGLFSRRWQTQWLVKEKKEQRYVQGETEVLYWRVEDFSKIILIFGIFLDLLRICIKSVSSTHWIPKPMPHPVKGEHETNSVCGDVATSIMVSEGPSESPRFINNQNNYKPVH